VLYIGDTRGNDEDDDKDDDDKHTHTHTHRHTYKATNYAVNRAKESPHISSHGTIHINADITTHTHKQPNPPLVCSKCSHRLALFPCRTRGAPRNKKRVKTSNGYIAVLSIGDTRGNDEDDDKDDDDKHTHTHTQTHIQSYQLCCQQGERITTHIKPWHDTHKCGYNNTHTQTAQPPMVCSKCSHRLALFPC